MKDNSLNDLVNLINEKYDVKLFALASPLNFKSSIYKELRDYELGHVKEGVGAGGISLLAFLDGFKNEEIVYVLTVHVVAYSLFPRFKLTIPDPPRLLKSVVDFNN